MGRAAVTKMGLNVASVIIWAISELFYFFLLFFLDTN